MSDLNLQQENELIHEVLRAAREQSMPPLAVAVQHLVTQFVREGREFLRWRQTRSQSHRPALRDTVGPAEARPMNQPGLTHMAVRVEDLDETLREIERFGGRVLDKTRIYNPVFDAHLVYVTDPDGTRLELVQTPRDPTR